MSHAGSRACPAFASPTDAIARPAGLSRPFRTQDISCLVLPIPVHAVFEQAVLQGEIGHDLLQGGSLTTEILHLAGGRGTRRVAGQPALAGLEELLGPAIVHRGGDALTAAQLGDILLAA